MWTAPRISWTTRQSPAISPSMNGRPFMDGEMAGLCRVVHEMRGAVHMSSGVLAEDELVHVRRIPERLPLHHEVLRVRGVRRHVRLDHVAQVDRPYGAERAAQVLYCVIHNDDPPS